ncbi:MAG TPA: hypothetical protein VF516_44985, partial [Kofleriaceae bacterium]
MANVDDMSADPARGILEPEHASVEPLGSVEPAARPSATRRSARPASGGNAAKPSRAKAKDTPATSGAAAKLDRKPARARTTREPADPDDDRAMTSGPPTIEPSGPRTAALRQGLPRAGAYRASVVTRS